MSSIRLVILFAAICLATGAGFAQTPALDSGAGPHVDLTISQRQTLYQSISKTQKTALHLRVSARRLAQSCPMVSGSRRFRRRLPS